LGGDLTAKHKNRGSEALDLSGAVGKFLRRVFLHRDNSLVDVYRENRMRPPGAVEERLFMSLCIRCNRCLEVCPYGSIRRAGPGAAIGTPYVHAESKACYLCMACCRLCPTDALDTRLKNPAKVRMGRARIDTSICYSHLFLEQDAIPLNAGERVAALCNTCYNVCPLPGKAIRLEKHLFPVVTDECVGCGICVERCPVRPRRAINIIPTGMGNVNEAGFYFRKARRHAEQLGSSGSGRSGKALSGRELLDRKQRIDGSGKAPKFSFPYEIEQKIEDWE
jgi:ferredoxin-type protein NapG